MRALRSRFWTAFVVTIAMSAVCYGQSTGSVVGTVRDGSGSVIPNAKVVAKNIRTGIPDETLTNQSGDYTFPNLAVGFYTISFGAQSFRQVDVQKIEIHVGSTIRQDATLTPAGGHTEIAVVAATPMVTSETSEVGQLVQERQISELPLDGRDIYSLLALTAGSETAVAVSTATFFTAVARPAIAGGRAGSTVFRMDGIDVNNQNLPSASVQPSVDAVQEFRAITQLAPASESGNSSVALVTKSGTNEFHGTAYDFLRNNVLDAQPYFQQKIVAPGYKYMGDQLRYNQFGGTIGGPILKNRTFFFFSAQLTRIRTLVQSRQLFPTAQMLAGDFSGINPLTRATFGPVYDPQTQAQFPGNQVPSSRFSSFASTFLPLAFLPANCSTCLSSGLGFNNVGSAPGTTNVSQYLGRIDHRISSKDMLFGNFFVEPGIGPYTVSPLPISRMDLKNRAYNFSLGETHVFSATLLNEFRLGYTRNHTTLQQQGDAKGAFTFQNTPISLPALYPTIAIVGYPSFGNGVISDQNSEIEDSWDINDRATWIHGKHDFQAGVEGIHARFINRLYLNAFFVYVNGLPPVLGFSGNNFADFLLGTPFLGLTFQGTNKADGVGRTIWSGYVQDNWKIHPRLTLNLGLRYEVPGRWTDLQSSKSRLGTLDISAFSQSIGGRFLLGNSPDYYVPGQGIVAGSGKPLIRGSIVDPSWTNFQPRIGLAFRPFDNNRTVIRGGFGTYYTIQDANSLAFEMLSPPFQYTSTLVNLPPNVPVGQPVHDVNFFPLAGPGGAGQEGDNPHNRDPRSYQWTLGVEHQLSNHLKLAAEYLGNHGIHLPIPLLVNQPHLPSASDLALLLQQPSLDTTLATARSTFPNIPLNYLYVDNMGTSSYQALNLRIDGRFGNRLNFSSVYTWSKALDISSSELDSPADTYNLGLNKSYAAFDHPHRFVSSWVYDLPFGETFLVPHNKVLRGFARGWEVSGIATFEAGPPYSVTMGADTSFRGGAPTYPDLVGHPVYSDIRHSGGIYLTPQNFSAPPFGQLGTLARNAFHGPGVNNFDFGFLKNVVLHENIRFQFRGELFNAFNHGQFQIPSPLSLAEAILPPPSGGTEPQIQYVPASQFGRVTARPQRVVQIAAKFIW